MSSRSDWHAEDVKAAIRKSGIGVGDLSKRHGYSESAVRTALRRPWPKMEAIIAEHLKCLPEHIWPSRYDASGRPLRRGVGRPKSEAKGSKLFTHRKSGDVV